jgi:hypothetical protein
MVTCLKRFEVRRVLRSPSESVLESASFTKALFNTKESGLSSSEKSSNIKLL